MKSLSRDSWLALGLFVVLTLVTVVALAQQVQTPPLPALTSFSTQRNGANALWQWLEALDYTVSDVISQRFNIPDDTAVVLFLEPIVPIEESHLDEIDAWVAAGGTLIVAGSGFGVQSLFTHYDFGVGYLAQEAVPKWETPLFQSPPMAMIAPWVGGRYFQPDRDDFVTHLTVQPIFEETAHPVLVSLQQGNGRVVLSTSAYPFSNEGLKTAENGELVFNMLAIADAEGTVWFNEWHHGAWERLAAEGGDLGDWLRREPLGRAFSYMGVVLFLFLVLRGQRFGRPVPVAREMARRAPLEYITAIANMSRRAGHRTAVLRDYHDRLKRTLSKRYRLDPTLPDDEFVRVLKVYDPNLDEHALRELLARLSNKNVSEAEMIQLAIEMSEWL